MLKLLKNILIIGLCILGLLITACSYELEQQGRNNQKPTWAKGYYCGSAGHVSQEAVKRYINEQEGKDVFEYSVFGSPNQKIGQFVSQTKLGEWS